MAHQATEADKKFIQRTIQLARKNVEEGGRPFACLIVRDATGEILGESANKVAQTGDPTSHAEILAIRQASAELRKRNEAVDGRNGLPGEDMNGCSFYIITDPCPMCMAAMEYCGPSRVVYSTTRNEYSNYYQDSRRHVEMKEFYQEIAKPHHLKRLPMIQVPDPEAIQVYAEWNRRNQDSPSAVKHAASQSTGASPSHTASKYPDPKEIDARRPEVQHKGCPVPAWGDAEKLGAILSMKDTAEGWARMIDIVSTRGDPLKQYYMSLRDAHLLMRRNYAEMIHSVGRNIFPLIVAADGEPGFQGVGTTYTLYLEDGSTKRIAPCPPEYEMYKNLAHMPLGLFTIISPYFKSAKESVGWVAGMKTFQSYISNALEANKHCGLDEEVKQFGKTMLTMVHEYTKQCIDSQSVAVEDFVAFTRKMFPLVQQAISVAARTQAHAAIPELQKWKAELGAKWKDTYVLIPTVWPVSEQNPRQMIFESLMDSEHAKTHIIKAEGAKDIDEARTTLGRVVGDRTVAHLVFGTATPDARNLVCALSTPRDIVASAAGDAISTLKK